MSDTNNIQLEGDEKVQMDFFNTQLREIQDEIRKHMSANEVMQNQAEKYMVGLRDKYGFNGQPMQYDPDSGEISLIDNPSPVSNPERYDDEVINPERVDGLSLSRR